MIKIDFATAVALYLTLFTAGVLIAWVYLDRDKFARYTSDDAYLWQCCVCTHPYIDSIHKEISICPVCGSYNAKSNVLA